MIDLSCVGGANYDTVDGPMYLSETYPVMILQSGESMIIAAGENGIPLPFMTDSTLMIELLACGRTGKQRFPEKERAACAVQYEVWIWQNEFSGGCYFCCCV